MHLKMVVGAPFEDKLLSAPYLALITFSYLFYLDKRIRIRGLSLESRRVCSMFHYLFEEAARLGLDGWKAFTFRVRASNSRVLPIKARGRVIGRVEDRMFSCVEKG